MNTDYCIKQVAVVMNKQLQDIADYLIKTLKEQGFTIHRYDAYSSNSIYLKFDYGVCNSIRISDHSGKAYLKYRYNFILGGVPYEEVMDKYPRFYFNETSIEQLVNKIKQDKQDKINQYGIRNYTMYVNKNKADIGNQKGFWKQAKLV
jgi:hypothetical protein